jgi:creatinine amidohydrolase/Fe(II)-dependent formamide hydrolase-like protein
VTQFAYPEAVKSVAEVSPKIAPMARYTDAEDYRAKFPDGRMGSDPLLAKPADGETLIGLSAKGLVADYRAFLES